jgi:ligand-binding sensor domain-containing protein
MIPLPAEAGLAITALAADAMNTIWVGTDRGLVRLPTEGDAEFFDSGNSPLVGSEVREISIDNQSGAVFVATGSGLSRLNAGIVPADRIENVIALPNPFEVESGGSQRVRFNAPFGSRVFIYTASGQFIIEVDGAEGWDGRNANGALVASGVYLFAVRGPEGDYGRGKIALIQRR